MWPLCHLPLTISQRMRSLPLSMAKGLTAEVGVTKCAGL
jgi:hypothetical protein